MAKEPPDFSMLLRGDPHRRLLLMARRELQRLAWPGKYRGRAPGGRTEHDFVHAAAERLRSGERRWNPALTAFENLWIAVSGEISSWVASADDTTTSRAHGRERDRLFEFLRHNADKDVWRMAVLMLAHNLTGSELAEEIGLEQHEVAAACKRLRTMTNVFLDMGRIVPRKAA